MRKFLPILCIGTAVAVSAAALTYDTVKDKELTVPEDVTASSTPGVNAALRQVGQIKSIPMRMPDGGYTAPVTFIPTDEQFAECTVIDVNGDGTKWTTEVKDGQNYFKYKYNTNNPADDWCILPAMNL